MYGIGMDAPDQPCQYSGTLSAQDYQRLYGRRMMVMKKLRGATAGADELCRNTSVNTIAPDLWVTVQFLDGSSRSFRPDMIAPAEHDKPTTTVA